MPLIIGTDEAGYGPNLGPLVISATVWKTTTAPSLIDLENALAGIPKADSPTAFLQISDSKQVYSSNSGLGSLETAIFSFLGTCHTRPTSWQELLTILVGDNRPDHLPWYRDWNRAVPTDVSGQMISRQIDSVVNFLSNLNLTFEAAGSRVIEPCEFNRLCAERGNKATVLTESTLELIRRMLETSATDQILVVCDKHGGRSKYAAVLQSIFCDGLVQVISEKPECSIYRVAADSAHIEFRFIAKGERKFPVALASMISKYLRELAMKSFNEYWSEVVPGIKPTAGYPVDAKRFATEIADSAKVRSIDKEMYWRSR